MTTPEELDKWAEKSLPILEKHGYLEKYYLELKKHNRFLGILKAIGIIALILLLILFDIGFWEGKMQSNYNQNLSINQNCSSIYSPSIDFPELSCKCPDVKIYPEINCYAKNST